MYKIVGDIEPRSFWLITTPSEAQLRQPYVCTEAGTLYGRKHFATERTGKDSYLLFYTFGGTGVVTQGGRSTTIKHAQALLMDCRTPQSYGTAPSADHWHHFWAHVDGVGVRMAAERLGLPALAPVYISRSRVKPHFNTIFELLEHESVRNEELVSLAVHALLAELIGAALQQDEAEDDPVRVARNYMDRHYADKILVEDLARAASVSPSYLSRLFRKAMGTSLHDYLLRKRITKAKQLLSETGDPIGGIAKTCGFSSESNFSYRFAQTTGISPRAYRKMTRESVASPASSARHPQDH